MASLVSGTRLWLYLAAVTPFLALWLVCRKGTRSERSVHAAELVTMLVGNTAFFVVFLRSPGSATRSELAATFVLNLGLVARAAYVPSTARRTLWIGAACCLPALVMTHLHCRLASPDPPSRTAT